MFGGLQDRANPLSHVKALALKSIKSVTWRVSCEKIPDSIKTRSISRRLRLTNCKIKILNEKAS